MKKTTLPAIAALAIGALALGGCSSSASGSNDEANAADAPITMATLPISEDPTAVNPVEALTTLLEEATGNEVETTDVPDYLSVVEAIRAGHEDIGIMSGFPSALAVNTGEVDVLVAIPGPDDPVSTCYVLADSPVQELSDFEGKKLGFADPGSSSGYFMPIYMLHEAGLERDTDYEAIITGSHENSFIALANGEIDAACSTTLAPEYGEAVGYNFAEGETRSIGESPSMPIAGTVLGRTSLSEEKRQKIIDGMVEVLSTKNAEALGAYGSLTSDDPEIEPDPSIFDSYVEIADVAGVKLEDLQE